MTLIFDDPTKHWVPTDDFRILPEDLPRPIDTRLPPMSDSMRADAAAFIANNGKPERGSNIVRNLKELPSPKFKQPPAETPGSLELSALSLDTDQRLPKWGNRSNDLTDKRPGGAPNSHREAPAQLHRMSAAPSLSNSAAKNPGVGALRHETHADSASAAVLKYGVYSSAPIPQDLETSVAPMLPKRAASDAHTKLPSAPTYNPTDLSTAFRKPSRVTREGSAPGLVPALAPPPATTPATRLSREGSNTSNRPSAPSSTPTLTPSSSAAFLQFPSAPATAVQLPSPQPAFVSPPPSQQPTFNPSSQPPAFNPPASQYPTFIPPSLAPAAPTFDPQAFLTSGTSNSQRVAPLYSSPRTQPVATYPMAPTAPPNAASFPLGVALAYRSPTNSDLFRKPFLADPKEAPSVAPTFVPSAVPPKTQ